MILEYLIYVYQIQFKIRDKIISHKKMNDKCTLKAILCTNVCILAQHISTRYEKHSGSSIHKRAAAVLSKQT